MFENNIVENQIRDFFSTQLNLYVPSADTDLVRAKLLDSLGLVDLLAYLEQDMGIEIPFDDLEVDNFRSIAKIAEFVDRYTTCTIQQ